MLLWARGVARCAPGVPATPWARPNVIWAEHRTGRTSYGQIKLSDIKYLALHFLFVCCLPWRCFENRVRAKRNSHSTPRWAQIISSFPQPLAHWPAPHLLCSSAPLLICWSPCPPVAIGLPAGPRPHRCRNKDKDFLYAAEFQAHAAAGRLTLHTAFSRDQAHKVYVQQRIVDNARALAGLIVEAEATVYIAGNAKSMPVDVTEALQDALVEHADMSPDEAQQYLRVMKRQGRLQLDTWA